MQSIVQGIVRNGAGDFAQDLAWGDAAERRTAPRHKVVLPALCSGAGRSEFYAVTEDVSSDGIRLKSATRPALGEVLVVRIRHVGAIEARVMRVEPHEFAIRVLTKRPAADHIARGLVALSRRQLSLAEPVRAHARIVPRRLDVVVTLASGATLTGRILNVSASGVGVMLDARPDLEELVVVGDRPARVARHLPNGIGAVFIHPLDPAEVDEDIVL